MIPYPPLYVATALLVLGVFLSFFPYFILGLLSCISMVVSLCMFASLVSVVTHLLLALLLVVFGFCGFLLEHTAGHWETKLPGEKKPHDHSKGWTRRFHRYYRAHAHKIGSMSIVSMISALTLLVTLAIRLWPLISQENPL